MFRKLSMLEIEIVDEIISDIEQGFLRPITGTKEIERFLNCPFIFAAKLVVRTLNL